MDRRTEPKVVNFYTMNGTCLLAQTESNRNSLLKLTDSNENCVL